MIEVKKLCGCGGRGVLEQSGRLWHVRCAKCNLTTEAAWSTMTVAIFEWEDMQAAMPDQPCAHPEKSLRYAVEKGERFCAECETTWDWQLNVPCLPGEAAGI